MEILSNFFKITTIIAMIGWVILLFLPTWGLADAVIKNGIAVILSLFYVYILFVQKNIAGEKYPKGSFKDLNGVMNLFQNPKSVLGGWVHYLAFDLMIGLYIKTQANAMGISHWLQVPCFLLAFMFGPAGYLLFFFLQIVIV
jgi:Domain of unknown function (DUF4281)